MNRKLSFTVLLLTFWATSLDAFLVRGPRTPPLAQRRSSQQSFKAFRNPFESFQETVSAAFSSTTLPRDSSLSIHTKKTTTANSFKHATASCALALTLLSASPALAYNSYNGALSDEQKLVAEAWRLVDNSFLDRTFNGQDWFQLRESYVHKTPYKSFTEAQHSIEQMVATLGDKYTRYLSPAKYQSIVDTATGTLAGIGVQIGINPAGFVDVADVEPNSPAEQAGLRIGDQFLEADGLRLDTVTTTPDDVALKLRGPVGSKVGVTVQRDGTPLELILTRQPITITAVRSYMSKSNDQKVGVIRVKNFSGTTASTVAKEVTELKAKGAQAYIIDVRGNPGGLLPGGVDTASLFLDANKPVVFVVNKKGVVDAQSSFAAGIELEAPLVVLVDKNTASAAEVFTAALQENGRATIAGEQTFGKGIVQTIRELSGSNGGLAITVARYETPQHHDINQSGIPVDVKTSVTCPKDDAVACFTDATAFQKAMAAITANE